MFRLSKHWWVFGMLVAASCGTPDPLDRDQFPSAAQSAFPNPWGAGGSLGAQPSGGGTGGGGAGTAGAVGAAGAVAMSQCPDDITLLFNRPIQQGGCQGSGCHVPGGTSPDLVSPNPETRLLDVTSRCNGRPYISADDSFLVNKITQDPPECGSPMPFLMPTALSAADEACILAWVEEVSGQ